MDDGLPLRKAAFACLDTLLDALPQVLELSSFMPYLAKGLDDIGKAMGDGRSVPPAASVARIHAVSANLVKKIITPGE